MKAIYRWLDNVQHRLFHSPPLLCSWSGFQSRQDTSNDISVSFKVQPWPDMHLCLEVWAATSTGSGLQAPHTAALAVCLPAAMSLPGSRNIVQGLLMSLSSCCSFTLPSLEVPPEQPEESPNQWFGFLMGYICVGTWDTEMTTMLLWFSILVRVITVEIYYENNN